MFPISSHISCLPVSENGGEIFAATHAQHRPAFASQTSARHGGPRWKFCLKGESPEIGLIYQVTHNPKLPHFAPVAITIFARVFCCKFPSKSSKRGLATTRCEPPEADGGPK